MDGPIDTLIDNRRSGGVAQQHLVSPVLGGKGCGVYTLARRR